MEDFSAMAAWRVGDNWILSIGHVPYRKSVALRAQKDTTVYTVAYFRNDEEANRFKEIMNG